MSSTNYNFLQESSAVPDTSNMRFGIVVSEWNNQITDKLLEGAIDTLTQHGVPESNITIGHVPGSFELVFGASQMAKFGYVDAIIAIGCVIRGDTPHFDYVCQSVTQGVTSLNADCDIPVIFGVLTVNNEQQALDRSVGTLGNKGVEAAEAAIAMVRFARSVK